MIEIDNFAAAIADPAIGRTLAAADRAANFLIEIETAHRVGLDVFGIGSTIARSSSMPPRLSFFQLPRLEPSASG